MSVLTPQRITVLGGLGFIGSHLCRALVDAGYTVRIFDRLYAARDLIRDIEQRVEIVEGDMLHTPDVLGAIADSDVVFHLVHTTVPGSSMKDPAYDVTSNIAATAGWLSQLSETRIRKLIYFSSGGTVYGISDHPLIDENHPTNPISAYGISKLAIEKYIGMYALLNGIEHTILRPANVYGIGQKLHINQGIIGVFIERALQGKPLEIWGTGKTLRDYIYVDDLVTAALAALTTSKPHVFNVSSGIGHSIQAIVEILRGEIETPLDVIYQPGRGFDVPSNVLDSSRLQTETGWQPNISLEEGIRRTIAWAKRLKSAGG